jgi:hypothetical protein
MSEYWRMLWLILPITIGYTVAVELKKKGKRKLMGFISLVCVLCLCVISIYEMMLDIPDWYNGIYSDVVLRLIDPFALGFMIAITSLVFVFTLPCAVLYMSKKL